ncbi:MAG: sigma-70 family RNA polymerase sigma factor [Peptococcaceae bacterium]|nr:sigma-70 family RNA polymerase sigma factor [Peptococcaceae bacterium]MBR2009619.1 sigma-70 family RNA polymerase sigma factor [Peptococcaceae bacterium]MBR2626977.1 sigma-70 family RNA polymerase sigma factor [Peptococcaceae bacterium]
MKLDLIFYLSMIEADDDKVKFEQLYSHYLKLALHRAGEFLPDEQLAEDAVSIAFLKIAQNMHKVDEAVSPRTKALIMRVVERSAVNLYKSENRHRSRSTVLEEAAEIEIESVQDSYLADLILELPEQYRSVILLKYAEEYKSKEIAELLGYSVSKVDQLASRGKKLLEKKLAEGEP